MATGQQGGCIWSLVIKKKRVGPLTEQEVRDRFAQGQISERTYTWRKGMKKWIRLGEVPELGDLLYTADSGPRSQPSPEEEVTPVKVKKTSTQPMFKITSPEDADVVMLGAAATMPAGGTDTVVDPREQDDPSSETGKWDGSAPSIPADASVPLVEPVPQARPAADEVVELVGGIDPNAETTRWDQEQVEQAISDLTLGESSSPEAASCVSQEIRMEGDLNQLFGREPSVPEVAPVSEPSHKPVAASPTLPELFGRKPAASAEVEPPDEVDPLAQPEPSTPEPYQQGLSGPEDLYEDEDDPYEDELAGYDDAQAAYDDQEEDDDEQDEQDAYEDEEEDDEEDEQDAYEEEEEDDEEDEDDEDDEEEEDDDEEEPLAALAAQNVAPEPEGDYSMGGGLVGARAKDSVLFSRTQFDTLASSMRGEDPPLEDEDEGSGLHDIQPLADQAMAGARDEDSVLFSRAQLAGITDGLEEAERDDSSSLIDIKPLASTYMTAGVDPSMGPDMGPLPAAPPASPLLFAMGEEEKSKHGLGMVVLIAVVGVLATLALLVGGLYLARPDLVKAFFAGPASDQVAKDKATDADKEGATAPAGDDEAVTDGEEGDGPDPVTAPKDVKKASSSRASKPSKIKRAAKKKGAARPGQRKPAPRVATEPAPEPRPRSTPRAVPPAPRPRPGRAPKNAKGDELDDLINTALGDEKPSTPKAGQAPRAAPAPAPKPVDEDLPEGLTREQIRRGMKRANIGVQACRSSMSHGGTVTIRVTVSGRTGRIIKSTALGSFSGSPGGNCVAASAKFAARFPRFGGPDMTFQYPYIIR